MAARKDGVFHMATGDAPLPFIGRDAWRCPTKSMAQSFDARAWRRR
jgi:hypothetical protein